MNEEVQEYNNSQGKHKFKLGLIKRKPKRTPTTVSLQNGLTYSRSSSDLTSPTTVVGLSAMADRNSRPLSALGVLTPPRTPSAPGSINESMEDRPVPVCDHPHDGKEISKVTVDISTQEIFDLMYVGSKYLIKFLEDRKTTDITIGGMGQLSNGLRGRTSTFTVPIGAGATANMTQVETWRACTDLAAGLHATDIEVISSGVPYADSYTVMLHVCGKKVGHNRSEFAIWAKINYKKQVFRLAKMAIESLVWRQVGVFYGGMGTAVEDAARMSPEERESWKAVLFPLDASPGSAPASPTAASLSPTTTAAATPNGTTRESPRVERYTTATTAPPQQGMTTIGSLPVPYWWIMVLLLSLTWLNAFMVARLYTAAPEPVANVAQLGTAVVPFPHQHVVDRAVLSNYHRFSEYQKEFRKSQVVYWKRVADMAVELLKEAEMSLDALDLSEGAEPSPTVPTVDPPPRGT